MGKIVVGGLLACLLAGAAHAETFVIEPAQGDVAGPPVESGVEFFLGPPGFIDPAGAPGAGDPFGGPGAVPPGWAPGGGGERAGWEGNAAQQLRARVIQAVQARTAGMTEAELERLLALIEQEQLALPAAATEILDAYQSQADAVQQDADKKIRQLRRAAVADLRELLARLIKDGQLDEAIAVRATIRAMAVPAVKPQPDPGSLGGYRGQIGKVLYFQVTGAAGNTIWGSGVYTDDSALATAAVHAGVLKPGQIGTVKVTILPGQALYEGSTRNGITSSPYGAFGGSYRVEPVPLDDEANRVDPAQPPDAEPGAEPGAESGAERGPEPKAEAAPPEADAAESR